MPLIIDYEKCCFKDGHCVSCSCGKACNGCVETCPTSALSRGQNLEFNASKCLECGACISACKYGALSIS